jgi:nicotianamine synthase
MIPEYLSNNGTLAKELLTSYPRLQNYKATIPVELGVISIALGSFPSSIAMLGSGPLPLTALSIMDFAEEKGQHGMRILNIDVVPERIRSSERIFSLLSDRYNGVSHQVADAGGVDLPDLSNCDAVYVASLIGNSDDDKIGVLRNTATRMRKGAVLVVRSSSGLSRLLWPVSIPKSSYLGFKIQADVLHRAYKIPTSKRWTMCLSLFWLLNRWMGRRSILC